MGQCLVEGCGAYALTGDICALCANTQPIKKITKAQHVSRENATAAAEAAAKSARPNAKIVLICPEGTTTPHPKFKAECDEYADRFFAILAQGPHGDRPETVHGCQIYHQTQKAANRTVFFDWQGDDLRIFGVGGHSGGDGAGNDSYSFTWFDGKNKNYNRNA